MNLKQIVKEHLQKCGFDGLCNDECGCTINDLMPCDNPMPDCEPRYAKKSENPEFDVILSPKMTTETAAETPLGEQIEGEAAS